MRRKQSGYTLPEVAIVIAIISLLIALAIKGQVLVNNTRVKNLVCDFKNIQVALYGYQDRFRALPGDDRNASRNLHGSGVPIIDGNGNTIIGGEWNSASGETFNLWQHVRLAGLLQGSEDPNSDTYIPLNTSGGVIGISEPSAAPITELKGEYIICSDAISGKFAKQLDTTLDDGNTATGSVMIVAAGTFTATAATATTAIVDDTAYLVCMGS